MLSTMFDDGLVSFDVPGMVPAAPGVWSTVDGDSIRLMRFDLPPDLPAGLDTVEALTGFYREVMAPSGTRLVELAIVKVDGFRAIRLIGKAPTQPSGMHYAGSLTIPFADRSFVVKVDCSEGPLTGVREAVLLDRFLAAGMDIDDLLAGACNYDAPEHDAAFPDHPVSRARRLLAEIERTLRFAPPLRRVAPFPLPER
jgi:hypothetical protein